MAENRKGRGNGFYYFSRGQLVILATGFTLTSVLVFLLGILIGQGIEERKLLKQEEPLVKVPLQPQTPGSKSAQGAPAKDELTFYNTLAKSPSGAQPARAQPAKEVKSAEKEAKLEVKEAKPAKPEPKEAKEAKETKPAVKEVKEVKAARASGSEEAPATAQKAKEKAEAEKSAAAETKKPVPAQRVAEAEKPKAETAPQDGSWTVQVNAFPDERSAQRLVERLKQKGYDAYMVTTNIKGRDWYRVRVGHFAARAQAKELQEDLQTKENFTKAITVSR